MSDMQQPPTPGKWKTFKDRLFSTALLLLVLGGVVLWNNIWGYRILVCIFCALTAWEWGDMLRRAGKTYQPWLTVCMGIIYPVALICILSESGDPAKYPLLLFWMFVLVVAFPVLLTIISFIWEMKRDVVGSRPLISVSTTLLSFIYPGWMFAFIFFAMLDGRYILPILWIVITTKLSDLFAYVSGMLFGGKIWKGNRLIPHISPKKTWEGLIGSLILTTLSGYWLASLLSINKLPGWLLLLYTVVLFFLAVFGDLAGSLIKRSLEIKDSGRLLPGIGGFFDLIDSLAFTIPFALIFKVIVVVFGYLSIS